MPTVMAIVGGNYEPKVKKGDFHEIINVTNWYQVKEKYMKKKIAKKRAAALGNMRNIREKQKQKYVSKSISLLSTRD